VLQCVAVCCSVLQSIAVCCSVLQCVAVCRSVLQCVAVCCSDFWGLRLVDIRLRVKLCMCVCRGGEGGWGIVLVRGHKCFDKRIHFVAVQCTATQCDT